MLPTAIKHMQPSCSCWPTCAREGRGSRCNDIVQKPVGGACLRGYGKVVGRLDPQIGKGAVRVCCKHSSVSRLLLSKLSLHLSLPLATSVSSIMHGVTPLDVHGNFMQDLQPESHCCLS